MKRISFWNGKTLAALFSLALALLAPALAGAAGYTVNSLADNTLANGLCTLREAVALHNGAASFNDCGAWDAAADKVLLWVGGTIFLDPGQGELVLTAPDLTIEGPGAPKLALDGQRKMSILVLDAAAPPALTVRAVTLRNGMGSSPIPNGNPLAGGIRMNNPGSWIYGPPTTLVVEDAVFLSNRSPIIYGTGSGFWSRGAAISSYGTLIVRRTLFQGNQSDMGTVDHDGPALIEDCEFNANRATSLSSALIVSPPGPWTVRRTLFRDNASTLDGAGAIRFISYDNSDSGLIESSTFTNNNTSAGTVLTLQGNTTVRNSTFAGNGIGAVFPYAVIEAAGSYLELSSNLFAANTRPDLRNPSNGTLKVAYNLFDTPQAQLPPGIPCAASTANDNNFCGIGNPGLGPLGPNGGRTWTVPLLVGSPALNSGSNPGGLATDQRGTGYARTAGPQTDIGAYEKQ